MCVCCFTGEGNGNPLQYSCLENPMDRGVLWATVHGVTKSQTRLKRLSTQSRTQWDAEQIFPKTQGAQWSSQLL